MNGCSSRSHAIFTITLKKRRSATANCVEGNESNSSLPLGERTKDPLYIWAKLHLVDLAGSERVSFCFVLVVLVQGKQTCFVVYID